MISIAQAFRVWKRLFAQRDYPFPPEAKWLCWGLVIVIWGIPMVAALGTALGISIHTNGWIETITGNPNPQFSMDIDWAGFVWFIPIFAWFAVFLYVMAVIRHWADVGIDRWINEGRFCRTCGMEGQRARVNRYDLTMRFRADRKEYDRIQRARRRGQRGRVTETA